MVRLIEFNDCKTWNEIVMSFKDHDVYYLHGYVDAFKIHGDGEPLLFLYLGENNRGICVMMKRDIADDLRFKGLIENGKYFDMVTPYGYGGFIFEKYPDEAEIKTLREELENVLVGEGIIAAFFRFHPVLKNADQSRQLLKVIDLGKTVAIDTSSEEIIWNNIISKNRNMIRKAEKSDVVVKHGTDPALFDKFIEIYNSTMDHDNAENYYYFTPEFYSSIANQLKGNYEMFYAELESDIIAMSIMIFANGQMHYHLSGSKYEYRNLAPSNLLLYKAALWANEQGFNTFHLGGGVGSGEDNLYKFKAAFNRHSDYRFSIGKWIIDSEKYQELCEVRTSSDENYNQQSPFFPVYRS